MTTEELERLLAQQPIAILHRLARGRIQRHFRAGKRRLIEVLLRHSAENRAGFESDLMTLIDERQARSAPPASGSRALPRTTIAPSMVLLARKSNEENIGNVPRREGGTE